MPPVSVLIKPASGACNMDCSYCFYRDEVKNRTEGFHGMMSTDTASLLIQRAFEFAEGSCTFIFQGGEPTLAGLDFFRQFISLEREYNVNGIDVFNSIQTNAYGLGEEWAEFFSENHFLVGVSLDGNCTVHDRCRKSAETGTFSSVMNTLSYFDKHNVEYNILCVVTKKTVSEIKRVYEFYRKHGFEYIQFIPCIPPLDGSRTKDGLTADEYGRFLIGIFDLWLSDLEKGKYVSIRHIDNWLGMLMGRPPENCGMNGCCSVQFVTESDGKVYPCDFYVLDGMCIGDVHTDSFAGMLNSDTALIFIEDSKSVPVKCRECRYYPLCRNGCRRDRITGISLNRFCSAYKEFFTRREKQIVHALRLINSMMSENN